MSYLQRYFEEEVDMEEAQARISGWAEQRITPADRLELFLRDLPIIGSLRKGKLVTYERMWLQDHGYSSTKKLTPKDFEDIRNAYIKTLLKERTEVIHPILIHGDNIPDRIDRGGAAITL